LDLLNLYGTTKETVMCKSNSPEKYLIQFTHLNFRSQRYVENILELCE